MKKTKKREKIKATYNVPEHINREMILSNAYENGAPFKWNQIKWFTKAEEKRQKFWKLIIQVYPELNGRRLEYCRSGFIRVNDLKGS